MRALALGLVFCGLGLAGGCRTPLPETRLGEGDPRPQQLLEILGASREAVPALRARARVAIDAPDLKLSRPQRLAVARPGRLRVEVLGLFGQLAAVLVADRGRYQLYEAGQSEIQEGRVSPSLLWRVARVDLEPGEAVDLLLGSPRPGPGLRVVGARGLGNGGIAFDRVDGEGRLRERYVFDAQGRLAETERVDRAGERIWGARFGEYRAVNSAGGGSREFAFQVELDFPRVEGKAKLDFQQVDLVAELPDGLFRLVPAETKTGEP